MRHYRKYQVAAWLSLAVQMLIFGGAYYLNCGSFSEPLTATPCRPWLPVAIESLVPAYFRAIPWLAEPGSRFYVEWSWFYCDAVPAWLREWLPFIPVIYVNVLSWTAVLASTFLVVGRAWTATKALVSGRYPRITVERSSRAR